MVRRRVIPLPQTKAEVNRMRAQPMVSRSLRRSLEKQEHLGLLNGNGRFLLYAERLRGGPQRPTVPPKWWIRDKLWDLHGRRLEDGRIKRNPTKTLEGSLWKWIASEVTWRAQEKGSRAKDESWLGEDDELSVHSVKNSWREICDEHPALDRKKWTDPPG